MENSKLNNIYKYDIGDLENRKEDSPWVVAYNNIEDNDKIFELGCATGYWGEYVIHHKNVEIIGLDFLEYHVQETKKLNCYKDVIQYNLNNLDNSLDYLNGYFDKIVILDVLEHLYEPNKVLDWCKKFLKPNGRIIISIPNIAHKTIIQQLLLDEFNYTEYGLLDRTHIRFFTINSFVDLLTGNNFEIVKVRKLVNNSSEYTQRLPELINMYIEMLYEPNVFQYVFVVQNPKNSNFEINNKNYKSTFEDNKLILKKCIRNKVIGSLKRLFHF